MVKSRWASDEKIRIVLESLNTNIRVAELCWKHGGRPSSFHARREKFFRGGKLALTRQLRDPVKEVEAKSERLKKLIGPLPTALLRNTRGRREERLAVIEVMREASANLRGFC